MRRAAPLLLAIAAFFALGILWIVTDRRASERVYEPLSSANTSPGGTSQAMAYLARRGKSQMLTRTIPLAGIERDAVVFRLAYERPLLYDPEQIDAKRAGPPRPREVPLLTDDEDAFVRRGGRMVIGAHTGMLDGKPASNAAQKVFPLWPGIDKLDLGAEPYAFPRLRPRMHAVFITGRDVVVARERIGEGDLFVLSAPGMFANESLPKAHHLALLGALAGKRPVYFDEVPHGIITGDGTLELMKDWNLGPFLAMLAVVALLIFWRASRRVGLAEDEYRETRSDAIDLVHSLGALYKDVTSYAEALSLYHDSLTRTVAHTSGLRGDALRARVEELTGGRRTMEGINEGFERLKSHRVTPA